MIAGLFSLCTRIRRALNGDHDRAIAASYEMRWLEYRGRVSAEHALAEAHRELAYANGLLLAVAQSPSEHVLAEIAEHVQGLRPVEYEGSRSGLTKSEGDEK